MTLFGGVVGGFEPLPPDKAGNVLNLSTYWPDAFLIQAMLPVLFQTGEPLFRESGRSKDPPGPDAAAGVDPQPLRSACAAHGGKRERVCESEGSRSPPCTPKTMSPTRQPFRSSCEPEMLMISTYSWSGPGPRSGPTDRR